MDRNAPAPKAPPPPPTSEPPRRNTQELGPPLPMAEPYPEDGRVKQAALLVLVPVRSGSEEPLKQLLDRIQSNLRGPGALIPFGRLTTVHFARFVLFPRSPTITVDDRSSHVGEPRIQPVLAFATDFDGPLDRHVEQLTTEAGPMLAEVFGHCLWREPITESNLARFLVSENKKANTAFVGTPGRSVGQILREQRLYDRIQLFLDQRRMAQPPMFDALELREELRATLGRDPDLRWALQPTEVPRPGWFARFLLARPRLMQVVLFLLTAAPLTVLIVGVLCGPLTGSWRVSLLLYLPGLALLGLSALFLKYLNGSDAQDVREDKAHSRELAEDEDHGIQNEMSSVIFIKSPRWFRRTVLKVVLASMHLAARKFFVEGALGGIRSIHFARWAVVDKGRRLLFLSNFDGTWESYLGEFVDRAATGLTGVWSHCVGFPKTRGLLGEGAAAEANFKAYSRRSQTLTQVWYSAYPDLTVFNINNNSRIRAGLSGRMTSDEAEAWLALL